MQQKNICLCQWFKSEGITIRDNQCNAWEAVLICFRDRPRMDSYRSSFPETTFRGETSLFSGVSYTKGCIIIRGKAATIGAFVYVGLKKFKGLNKLEGIRFMGNRCREAVFWGYGVSEAQRLFSCACEHQINDGHKDQQVPSGLSTYTPLRYKINLLTSFLKCNFLKNCNDS